MIKYVILFFLTLTLLSCKSQISRFDIIEKAINAPEFIKLVNQQKIFNQEKELTIYIDSSLIEVKKYNFNNKEIGYYDISDPINRMSPSYNFLFSKLSFGEEQTHIEYRFFPNWLIKHNEKEFPSYNNNTTITVYCILEKKLGNWEITNTTITDINFPEWMHEKGSGFDYISNNYVPLKTK